MKFKALENVTRSQIENMNHDEVMKLGAEMQTEAEMEKMRQAILNVLDETEKKIVTPKVVQ